MDEDIYEYGEKVGVAFQIVDDLLENTAGVLHALRSTITNTT